jgi:hypothetical protein
VIENRNVERLGGARQSTCCAAVGIAWPGIAAGVIVGEDDACAAKSCRVDDDVLDRHTDRFRFALVTFDMKAARRVVDMSDPQSLAVSFVCTKAGRKEAAGGLVAVEKRGGFGTLEPHAQILCEAMPAA